ncbi:MAG: DUF4256 domain-containing protein [Candidatus Sumerlaeia bacterium]
MPVKTAGATPLPPDEINKLLSVLKTRFEQYMNRHRDLTWGAVQARLEKHADKLHSLHQMERTGGEPDVVGLDSRTGEVIFFDCSSESPAGRRSLCYDPEALDSRKVHKPAGSAVGLAAAMGVALLTEDEYHALQALGEFDAKTSSWIRTPPDIRAQGGALFCDRRFGRVFTYHNSAQSYFAACGFRASLRV